MVGAGQQVAKKHELEAALYAEKQEISAGRLKEDNPLDLSEAFRIFCEACRRGDLKVCQEQMTKGVNINARDRFDYTPLILASLCGHFEVVQHLLEAGALCERDTFQGERCLYNALNDKIRNLLLSYDYSKSSDPLQPLAAHVTSLLNRDHPKTSDITLTTATESYHLHKFVLAARSPYFAKKLAAAPDTPTWRLPNTLPSQSFETAIKFIYLSDVSADLGDGEEEQALLTGIDKLSRHLEVDRLFSNILEGGDRRLARQRRTEEVTQGRDELNRWFQENVLKHKLRVETSKVDSIKWDKSNSIFADVLLRAEEEVEDKLEIDSTPSKPQVRQTLGPLNGIPIGPIRTSRPPSRTRTAAHSVLFPVHRAMLLRSEYFNTMFSSGFREAQETPHLQIITIDCSPAVLETVLTFLYTESADIPLDMAIDVLFAADLLFIEKLKVKAAVIISTLGNGAASIVEAENPRGETDEEELVDIYDVVRAGWDTRVHRLEEFGARYIAYRLERYIDQEDFAELVRESAGRIKGRQETDTVELIDDIRYYLSERFRLRFEDTGLDDMMDEQEQAEFGDVVPSVGFDAVQTADQAVPTGTQTNTDAPTNKQSIGSYDFESQSAAGGVVRTLDGEEAGDEFAQDAINYQILLGKIDNLLEKLALDA